MKTVLEYLEEATDELCKRYDKYDEKVVGCTKNGNTYEAIYWNSIRAGLLEASMVIADVKQKARVDMINEEIMK